MISTRALWFAIGYVRFCQRNKQSRRGRLLEFQLEQTKHALVFFLLFVHVVGRCFLVERGVSKLCAYIVECIENGNSVSVVVRFLVYLLEKQAVKSKKSTEVSA